MKKFFKFFLWIAIIGVLLYFGYGYYKKWYSQNNNLQKISSQYLNQGSHLLNSAKDNALNKIQSFLKNNAQKISQFAGNQLISLGESLIPQSTSSLLLENVNKNLNLTSNLNQNNSRNSGLLLNSNLNNASNYIFAVLVKAKTDVAFSIGANEQYQINWGDGTVSSGNGSLKPLTINHSWEKPGDYLINVNTFASSTTSTYSFTVRVIQ